MYSIPSKPHSYTTPIHYTSNPIYIHPYISLGSLVHPTYRRMDLLYSKPYNWSKNYCIHLYRNEQKKFPDNSSTLHLYKGASGEIMQYIWSTQVNVTYLS